MFKLFTPLLVLALTIGALFILEKRKTFDVSTLVQIDPMPQTKKLIQDEKYVEAEEYLSYFINYDYVNKNPEATELLQQIQTKRDSFSYKRDKFFEGVLEGKSDESIGQVAAIGSDFLVIGDVRDLAIEGMHYANDEKVDKFILSLSSLGLLTTATTVYGLGATAPLKGSISVLKYAKRVKKIPLWLQTKLIDQIALAKKTKSLQEIEKLLLPIHELYKKVGLTQALHLLHSSKNLKELKFLSNFSKHFGKKSQVLLGITNNNAIKYMKSMPNISQKSFLYASTYGTRGLKGLKKLGENKFLKRVGFSSNLAKTTYKGNLNSLFNALHKNIPNSWLYAISLFGLFYFTRKFFTLSQKLF